MAEQRAPRKNEKTTKKDVTLDPNVTVMYSSGEISLSK